MDLIVDYGVTLRKLTRNKIELVRIWRNSPKISQYMEFREEITREMQDKWFEKISNSGKDFYFIIEVDGHEIGCVNIKDVDFQKKTGETGIFIWDDNYLNGTYGTSAALCIHDFAFKSLKLDYLHGHALAENKRVNRLNNLLGYHVLPNQEALHNQELILYKADYYVKTENIRNLLNKIYK